jgi:hypothetical protein
VHDCSFTTGYEYAIGWQGNGGVIWNCSFYTYSDLLGGISFVNTSPDNSYWNQPDSMGASGDPSGTLNTYVEDCSFYDAKMAMSNFDDNSRVVWRHNLMSNAVLASYGQETSIWGTRHWEIYSNTFVYSTSGTAFGGDAYPLTMDTWFEVRGGTGRDRADASKNEADNLYQVNGTKDGVKTYYASLTDDGMMLVIWTKEDDFSKGRINQSGARERTRPDSESFIG